MQEYRSNKKKEQKKMRKKTYEKPRLIVRSRVPIDPTAWGCYQP